MCRWFAYISATEPCLLEDVLVSPKHSLVKQVSDHYLPKLLPHEHDGDSENDVKARNIVMNFDGLGIAWYTSSNADFELGKTGQSSDGLQKEVPSSLDAESWQVVPAKLKVQGLRPALYKTIQPPRNDSNFLSICANSETKVLFAHIRASSGTAIANINNHPFVFGRHAFMHNGSASDFQAIKRDVVNELSPATYNRVSGGTDSEHIAALYMSYLTKFGTASTFENEYPIAEMAAAMHRAVATIMAIQQKNFGSKKKPNSLNLCATDGSKLIAYRFRNHKTSQSPSLYYSTKAGMTLNRKYPDHASGIETPNRWAGIPEEQHGKHLIIASEPSTYKEEDWEVIGRNQFLIADADGVFKVEDCPYYEGWDAADPPPPPPGTVMP
ncbi:putative glutamine amidotransferase DUG3 [Fulvia fulva]|uniref:Glutamine amidotransferase DUG3 n=1 Tax=Passalora fulva TaxID=5499 RepID=A0A9Q8PBF3_PASFU|nr:putative glutamine amidotransferase DUG3 [Fulvia fulva]KAK4622009.1 putative glutamine amidotransferase DUG3 [Fulvia fulva]UJO19337.1 putative glutamine amidotransferase DUG3 [Fulvia fulva]WPV16058.1 putative glutamine amidotransferase DUG3 [Fulvia fulva]WPV31514.1 putative glutamine amidotransferase DUG3 [Fulvia fulva]